MFHDISDYGPFPLYAGFPFFILGRWIKRAEAVAESFKVNIPADSSLLILRSTGDEAAMAISAFQFGGWLLTFAMRLYAKCAAFLHGAAISFQKYHLESRKARRKQLLAVGTTICAALIFAIKPLGYYQSVALALALCLPLAFFLSSPITTLLDAIPLIGFGLLTPLLVLIMLFAAMPLGAEAGLIAAFYEVTVESVPAGEWLVHQIVPSNFQGLSHSSTYEEESALTAIEHWIALHRSEQK